MAKANTTDKTDAPNETTAAPASKPKQATPAFNAWAKEDARLTKQGSRDSNEVIALRKLEGTANQEATEQSKGK